MSLLKTIALKTDRIAFWGLWVLLVLFAFWGVNSLPFHPDESTYLFMSADFDAYLQGPGALAWEPERSDDPAQRYRLLDAPITRYVIGFGRWLAGDDALPVDWDWGKTWSENASVGALPSNRLLFLGRLAVTALLPFSLLFGYLTAKKIGGELNGLLTMLLLGVSALVLLHARRAMAEGALLFGILFFNYTLSIGAKKPWLTAVGAALAFNAKFSALALFPIGLLSVIWMPNLALKKGREAFGSALQYVFLFALLTFLFNPILWRQPFQALGTAVEARGDLLERQFADVQNLAPEKALQRPEERLAVLGAHLYLTPLMFAEVGNYLEDTAQSERTYASIPGHNLFRDPLSAALLLFFTLFGLAVSARRVLKERLISDRLTVLLLFATIFQIGAYIIAIPLHWQRYAILLVPYVTLWTGYGLSEAFRFISRLVVRSQEFHATE